MCGNLLAIRKSKHPISKALLKRFKAQKGRGAKGFGFIAIENGRVKGVHRFEKEADMEKALEASKSNEIMFHHRLPTSTPNYEDMAHPIEVKNAELEFDYYVQHNGVLRNEDTLRKAHMALGYKYTTDMQEIHTIKTRNGKKDTVTELFNDSEAFAIELARFLDGKSQSIDAIGTIAFVCIQTDKKGRVKNLYYGRNSGNPLVIETNGDLFFIKSEGDGEKVEENHIFQMDYETRNITSRYVQIGRTYQAPAASTVTKRDDWHGQGRIPAGFGHDGERIPGRLLSPMQQRGHGVHGLDWVDREADDDGPIGLFDLPTIEAGDRDFDTEVDNFATYYYSDEHLSDLLEEIATLTRDIKDAEKELERVNLSSSDRSFWEETVAESRQTRKEKEEVYKKVEDAIAGLGK